jgi:putative component of toxin-antitoxin plasmid stabilization module
MSKFALRKLAAVEGRIPFSMLEVDGVCPFEEFCSQIRRDGNLSKQLITAIARMNQVANLQRLPVEKFRDITPTKDVIKEFEIKTGDLRIYLIKEDEHIVILGGKKNTQPDDIKRFRSIKKRYIQSKRERYVDA